MVLITFENFINFIWNNKCIKKRIVIFITFVNLALITCRTIKISPEMFNSLQSNVISKHLPYYATETYPKNVHKHRMELVPLKSSPEHVILLDTDVTDWSNWTRNTGKYEGWRQQTHPILQRKIYGVCQIAQEHNDNWLYSPLVHVTEAKSITIEITFTIRECSEHPNSELLKYCQEVLELLLLQVDGVIPNEKNMTQTQNLFTKLATLSTSHKAKPDSSTEGFLIGWNVSNQNKNNLPDSSSEQVTVHISRFNVHNENIQIAVRDRGSCSTIRRVRLGFVVCPFIRRNFIEYPRTVTGKIMEGLTVDGHCIDGAALLNNREIPKLICRTDGLWYYEAMKSFHSGGEKDLDVFTKKTFFTHLDRSCECMPGFGILNEHNIMDQLCEPCGLHYFKPTFGPFTCQRCPLNSHNPFHSLTSRSKQRFNLLNYRPKILEYNESTRNEIDSCVCDSGYYRHPVLDRSDSPCTRIPSAPRNVTVNLSDPARVQLFWNEPLETGGRSHIWYIIKCLEIPNHACSPHLTFIPAVPTLMTSLVLIGLNLGKSIILSVIATNELSEHLPHIELIQSTASITAQLPNPINISVGSVHFNEVKDWQANNSLTQQLTIDSVLYDKTKKNTVDKVYEFSWEPPQFVTSKSFIQVSALDDYSPMTNEQSHSSNADFTVIEYQVYVWINSSLMEFEDTYWHSKPALTHFLSESSIFLTDLPQPGILAIWVRPHLSAGWGIFKKSVYHYSNVDENHIEVKKTATHQTLFLVSDSRESISLNGSDIMRSMHTSKRFQILMGILGIGVILLFCLLTILIFLRFCNKRTISTEENTQFETDLVPHSANGITEKTTACDMQLEASENEASSEHSTSIKSNTCDLPLQPVLNREISKEIDPRRIMIRSTIGEGEFGKVCAGDYITTDENKVQLVAIKMLHPDVSEKTRQDFLAEANILSQLDHPNIVQLIGLVIKSEPKMIVIEFMENGSLDNYLRLTGNTLSMEQLLYMLRDIACGMNYLSQLNYVHRDLAARNILVDKFNTCKVSDFGLTRRFDSDSEEDAYTITGGKVPIRWTAPEAIMYRKITFASDIWSFGIVAWELFSLGERPYWNWTNQAVISMLDKGYRLPPPNICPSDVYQIMTNCWNTNPDQRPDFNTICLRINHFIDSYLQTNKRIKHLSNNQLKNDNSSLTSSLNDDIAYCWLPTPYDSNLFVKSNNNTSGNNNISQVSRTSSYKMYTSFSSSNTYFNINVPNITRDGSFPNSTGEYKSDLLINDAKNTIQNNVISMHDTGKRVSVLCSQDKYLHYAASLNRNKRNNDSINETYIPLSKQKCNAYA
ncbi:Ephrin type-A receptor 3 [Schistosoma japonicum]|nr:Ephrin type-A receptor 3 [Schistosoma japonicum]